MLHTKFQASKPSSSEEEDFLNIFLCNFYDLNLEPLARDHLEPRDLHLNKLGKELLGNATHKISSI